MEQWLNVAIYAAAIVGIGGFIVLLSHVMGPRKKKPGKLDPYECGVQILSSTRERFSVHFYLVAILFILFDLEIAFLFPWAVVINDIGFAGFVAMMVFLGILTVGFVYEWMKGALEWE